MPLPIDTELRVHGSPVPTQIVFGFDGSIASAPIDCTASLSNTGLNVVPPSYERHTPPEAAPMNTVVLPPSFTAATAAMRPLIVAAPMLRALRPEIAPASIVGLPGLLGGDAAVGPLSGGPGWIAAVTRVVGILNMPSSTATSTSTRAT